MVRNHHSIGNAGEFYVLAQLAQRGYIAGKTDDGQTLIDVIATVLLLPRSIQTLMSAAGQAMQQKNPGAVVSCIRQLDHMTGTGYNSHRGYGFHRRLH